MIGFSCQGVCHRSTVPEIILSEAHCQANRGINALTQSNFISYLSFFSFGFLPAFFVYFFGEGTPAEVAKQHRADSRQKELEAEIKKLRKQLAEKDEVIEILKKSVGILSQP